MTHASIRAIATARPTFRMTRAEWLEIAARISPPEVDRGVLARLAERSGIETRWCAAFESENACFYDRGEIPGTAQRMALWSRAARAMALAVGLGVHLVAAACRLAPPACAGAGCVVEDEAAQRALATAQAAVVGTE